MPDVIIVGSGGHAKVVIDLIKETKQYDVVGCVSKDVKEPTAGVPVLGSDEVLERLLLDGITNAFIAVGDNQLRYTLAKQLTELGFSIINVISPKAVISSSVQLGRGIVVMPGAVINVDSKIGDYAIINTNASVDHDCVIGASAHVAPGCNLAGNVNLGQGVFLGIGTRVIPGITIGEWTTIGAGGTVIRNIPPSVLAVGTPAKVIKTMKESYE